MDIFLDSMEQSATSSSPVSAKEDLVSDEEIDRMIQADVLAAEKTELGKLDQLESEIAKELGGKQKDWAKLNQRAQRLCRGLRSEATQKDLAMGKRIDSDEWYVLDLCDKALGVPSL